MGHATDQLATPAMSPADIAAHELASYVRPTNWTDDDNKPAIPRIPGPRKPSTVAPLPVQAAHA